MHLFERIRRRFFPTPTERWQHRCEKWLQLARVFEQQLPESVELLVRSIETPEQIPTSYDEQTSLDGKTFPELFGRILSPDDVDPEELFQEVFGVSFEVFAEVDWKVSNEDIYLLVNSMLHTQGYDDFDWAFRTEHEDEITENYEFIDVIDQQLKGSGYRLVSFDTQGDSFAFAVVPDLHYDQIRIIEPYH